MTPDGIVRGAWREAEGLYQGGEAGGTDALIRRRKAEAQNRSTGREPTHVLANEGLISGPTVLEAEGCLEAC